MDFANMTRKEFERLPSRKWDEDIGVFDGIVILPAKIGKVSLLRYNVRKWFAGLFKLDDPGIWEVEGMHDSSYRCMDFVAIRDRQAICRLSGYSDVIHVDGIGGLGYQWLWSIDCLPKSGLLRMWPRGKMKCSEGLSSFEIFSVKVEITKDEILES